MLFEANYCLIIDSLNKKMFKVQMKGKIFILNMLEDEQVAIHKKDSNIMLWCRRLGHFHQKTLLFMKKNNLGEGMPD